MTRSLVLVYGIVVYLLFGLAWLYFIAFRAGCRVPRGVASGAAARTGIPLAIVLGCPALFFAPPSVRARARAKRALVRVVPPAVERSTYVLVATLAMILIMAMW